MDPETAIHQENLRARAQRYFRTALVAVAVSLGAPTLAMAQQITAPTGATLSPAVPILVQWTPAFWPTPMVEVVLHRWVPGGHYPVTGPISYTNDGQTQLHFPNSLPCDPTDNYMVTIEGRLNISTTQHAESAKFKFACSGSSITVIKKVINDSGRPIPIGTFLVDVTCAHNVPSTTLALSSANNFQDSVMSIPLGRQCTITEQAPKAPAGCRWLTTYPQGRSVVIGNAGYRREVHNRLSCRGSGPAGPLGPVDINGPLIAFPVDGAKTGSITIEKRVINDSGSIPPPNIAFVVQVNCAPGPNVPVTLSSANGFAQSVGDFAAGSACTIAEQAPVMASDLALRCRWETSYPDGQNVTMPNPATALRLSVINRWICK